MDGVEALFRMRDEVGDAVGVTVNQKLFDDTERKVNVHRDLLAGLALRCHFFRKAATSAPFLKGP
jgi:hypothetical protein